MCQRQAFPVSARFFSEVSAQRSAAPFCLTLLLLLSLSLPAFGNDEKDEGNLPANVEEALSALLSDTSRGRPAPSAETLSSVLDFVPPTAFPPPESAGPDAAGTGGLSAGTSQHSAEKNHRLHTEPRRPRRGRLSLRGSPQRLAPRQRNSRQGQGTARNASPAHGAR